MKKRITLFGTFFIFCVLIRLSAGPVSLEPGEIAELRALVATNAAAAQQFSNQRRTAEAALSAAPDPIEKVVTEGHLANDPLKIRTEASLADMGKIASLAWTWAVTGGARYADKARQFILTWAEVNHPDGDAINETQFEPLIVSYDLLRGTFPAGDRLKIDGWLRHKADVLWKDRCGLTENWFSHRLKVVGLIGWTIGDQTLIADAVDGFHRQIGGNFKPDGASTDFYKRDALHYHIYTVEPLLTLARTAERCGLRFFEFPAADGATLHRGVDFVVPFATAAKTHIEFVHSQVSFDRKRAQNGQGEYQAHPWKPRAAIGMFSQAAWFRPEYGVLAARLAGHLDETFFNWQMVINAVSHRRIEAKYKAKI